MFVWTIAGMASRSRKALNFVARLLDCILSVAFVRVVRSAHSRDDRTLHSKARMPAADTVPWWHSLTRDLFALLWQSWYRLLWLTGPGWPRPPSDAERALLCALRPPSRVASARSKAHATRAAIVRTNPAHRGLLPGSHALVCGIQLLVNIHHHPPSNEAWLFYGHEGRG